MRFLKEGDKTAVKAIDSSVKTVGLGNGQTKFLSIPFETLDLLNTR